MARGLCFKPRAGIGKYPDGPMAPGEQYKLSSVAATAEPAYDAAYLSKVDYDLWLGPAPKRPFNRNRFHYNWHWHWDYGNGDTGNQGPHQFDIARWGLGKQEHPIKVVSTGGYFGPESSQETPDTQTALYEYADGTILEFGTRGEHTNDEGGVRIGELFYGSKGWLWIDETGNNWQSYQGPVGEKNEKGPGSGSGRAGRVSGGPDDERRQPHAELRRRHPRQRPEASRLRHRSKATSRRRCRTWRTSRIASAISCASIRRRSASRTTRRRTRCSIATAATARASRFRSRLRRMGAVVSVQ